MTESHLEQARELQKRLRGVGLRVAILDTEGTLASKIRLAQAAKVPYVAVLGDKEIESDCVAIRFHDGRQMTLSISDFISKASENVTDKSLDPTAGFNLAPIGP